MDETPCRSAATPKEPQFGADVNGVETVLPPNSPAVIELLVRDFTAEESCRDFLIDVSANERKTVRSESEKADSSGINVSGIRWHKSRFQKGKKLRSPRRFVADLWQFNRRESRNQESTFY
jgi:hypothetical protein